MLDDLLGRTELKNHIQELESKVESLEERLEAENRRRKEAVTEKQRADRRVNKLESKIDELEGRLERKQVERDHGFRGVEEVGGDRLDQVLGLLESVEGGRESLTTAYVAPGDAVDLDLDGRVEALLRRVDSGTGKAVYLDDWGVVRVCLVPPLPVESSRVLHDECFRVDRSLYGPMGVHAVAAVRSDTYAGGVFDGDGRTAISSVSSNVKGGHSKGGWSQSRYERRREEQVDRHVKESVESFREMIADYDLEVVAVVGEDSVVERFADMVGADVTRSLDARGKDESLLEDAYGKLWAARLYVL